MRVFVSSVIQGFETMRAAAVRAVRELGYEAVLAEEIPARPVSPRLACLTELRASDVMLLLLGSRYGGILPSGVSATHEEFREAQDRRPVLVFRQLGVELEPQQKGFVAEAEAWAAGRFRAAFNTPEQLRVEITRALHEFAVRRAADVPDAEAGRQRALALLPERRGSHSPAVTVAVGALPAQTVLRPSELEKRSLEETLFREALLGERRVFDRSQGTPQGEVSQDALVIRQGHDGPSIAVCADGCVGITVAISPPAGARGAFLPVLVEEGVAEALNRALSLACFAIDLIDGDRRITHVVPVTAITGAQHHGWRTDAEHRARPNTAELPSGIDQGPVLLSSPAVVRAVLTERREEIIEDLLVLLRRQRQSR